MPAAEGATWWRREQLSVATALASARHRSAGPPAVKEVDTRLEGSEEVDLETHDGLRALTTPPYLCPRLRGRIRRQPRSVTWLPGCLA